MRGAARREEFQFRPINPFTRKEMFEVTELRNVLYVRNFSTAMLMNSDSKTRLRDEIGDVHFLSFIMLIKLFQTWKEW